MESRRNNADLPRALGDVGTDLRLLGVRIGDAILQPEGFRQRVRPRALARRADAGSPSAATGAFGSRGNSESNRSTVVADAAPQARRRAPSTLDRKSVV